MPANGRAFLLLAARSDGHPSAPEAIETLAGNKRFMSLPGLPATLNYRPAAWRMCPVRPQWQRGADREHQLGITGLVLTGNTRKRCREHIQGLGVRCQRNPPCYSVMASAAEL